MATTPPGPAPPAGGAQREEESGAVPPPPLATCSCHGSSKRRAAEVSDPLQVRVHCPRDPWCAPALMHPERSLQIRQPRPPRNKPREPGGRRSQRGSHRQGGSRLQSPCCTCQPPSGQPWTTMGATCSSFFVQRLSGRKYLVPNWQVCPVSASARGALVCKVLHLAHGCRQECSGNFGHYG